MEEKMEYKISEKTAQKLERDLNKIPNRKEINDIINRYTEYMRVHIDSSFDILRESIQAQIISNLALIDILEEKGVLTKAEYEQKMTQIAQNIDKMLSELKEGDKDGEEKAD